jgi:hypothetical protein
MAQFDEFLLQLQERQPAPPLFPTAPYSVEISRQMAQANDTFFDAGLSDAAKEALRSGLLLLNDDLHASHELSQSIHTPTGSFWHAIMHRREGDAGNSQYWWRLTGDHPAFSDIHRNALKYLQGHGNPAAERFGAKMQASGRWDPVDFVRACSQGMNDDEWLRQLQLIEMTTLLRWCKSNL